MSIGKANYDNLNWIDALAAKPRDDEARLAGASEAEAAEDALRKTASAAFELPTNEETKSEAIARASKDIGDKMAVDVDALRIKDTKDKLASREIDPVALGVTMHGNLVSAEEWDGASDPNWVLAVAKKAALLQEKRLSEAWQERSMNRANPGSRPEIENVMPGRIMSAKTIADETTVTDSLAPRNANSLLDPGRAERLAKGETENAHDASIQSIREAQKAREQERLEDIRARKPKDGNGFMRADRIMNSGGQDCEAFVQRVPRDQISMLDDVSAEGLTPEQLKEKLAQVFTNKVDDQKSITQEANKKRRESIQRESSREKDKSWEKVSKPLSTGSLQERLMNAWMPEEPEK